MRLARLYYGWFDPTAKMFRLSLLPPDAPVRPSLPFPSKSEAMALAQRKRATIMWWPPLTRDQEAIKSPESDRMSA